MIIGRVAFIEIYDTAKSKTHEIKGEKKGNK